jgi:hypothetical protein
MKSLVTRISRAAMMGLAWAAAWLPFGVVGGPLYVGELEPEHLGGPLYAGFFCGLVFAAVSGFASGRRLGELSAYHAAAWGVVTGLFVGVLPFVLGGGDTSDSQAGWMTLFIALIASAAAIAASRRWLGALSPSQAATLAGVVSGLIGVLSTLPEAQRFLPLALMGGLSGLSALTGFLSPAAARWLHKQNSPPASAKSYGG